ncbi:hypothetical protein [Candidatus Nitrotoga fabula]|uniref:Uncharacterized protein n=1 Tax=Candidatus Nitrotoga fabula TaxID=2182327 RepID=A0A916BF72_9PROT|nr:hypothetical protein [Candidatus Nitrotoga fabula]CAE6720054.1 hypothetical protein NTGZN8_300047 [Candidatus Nitrotoga fabula]
MADKTGVPRISFDVTAEVLTGLREVVSQVYIERDFDIEKLGTMLGEAINPRMAALLLAAITN